MLGSIRGRLIALHLAALIVAAVMLPALLYWRIAHTVEDMHHLALQQQAKEVASYLRRVDGELVLSMPPPLLALYNSVYGRYEFAVLDERGRVLFSADANGRPLGRPLRSVKQPYFIRHRDDGGHLYGANVPFIRDGVPVMVQVAEDGDSRRDFLIDDMMQEFLPQVAWVILPVLLVLLTMDVVIFTRTLRPLMRASALARGIGPEHSDLRLPEQPMLREVQPLVSAVNAGLDRLAHGIDVQRGFVADAAHELRTPLAILRAQAEELADRNAAEHLIADIDAMSRVVKQMLDMADSEALTIGPEERADLTSVAMEVAAYLAPVAIAEGKEVALVDAPGPRPVAGNAIALGRALRNLIENAIRHTPRGTAVEIEVRKDGTVLVRDAGPGVPVEQRDAIFQRFWRGERRRAGSAGLGLAIVAHIARMHGGSVSVRTAPGGGAEFALHVPPAAAPM